MKKLHEKSHQCEANAWKIGNRRRRCAACGCSWSVWPKQRGRKPSRAHNKLLDKVFVDRQRLRALAPVRLNRISLSAISYRLKRIMTDASSQVTVKRWKNTDYVLLIDALWYRFGKERWTVYLMAVKQINDTKAVFLPPVMLSGKEALGGWTQTIATLPKSLKTRIKALVSDGWRGVEGLAVENDWILQRCHFHLISQLQVNRGRWKQLPDQALREQIYQTIRTLLVTGTEVKIYTAQLIRLLKLADCPKRLKSIANDFLSNLNYFRSYMNHPNLHLPNTTNSMESKNRQIRDTCRYQRTPKSLNAWITAFLKLNPKIVCNSANHTQN